MELAQLREQYPLAADNPRLAREMWRSCRKYQGDEPILLAYQGAARSLMAHHSWNPLEKLDYLKEAMRFFRKAIKLAPNNPEIRFLRFSIQTELPAFLSMDGDIPTDKAIILQELPRFGDYDLDPSLAQRIFKELEKSKRFTETELASLQLQIEA